MTQTQNETGMANRNAEIENSYQKQIQRIRDEIQALKEEVAEHGHDSLYSKLKDANSELATAWQIAGLDE